MQRFTRAQLADGLSWWDVLGLSLLTGIGFTVSLLIGELAFGAGSAGGDDVKKAVRGGLRRHVGRRRPPALRDPLADEMAGGRAVDARAPAAAARARPGGPELVRGHGPDQC